MPLFSIIVPVYKVSEYLSECIESIIAQSITDYELILVDDGSPDDSGMICDAYSAKDRRIRVIHKENNGLSSARNAGMAIASGQYICFVDGDDTIQPNLLEAVLPYFASGADMVAFHFQWVFEDGQAKALLYHETGTFDIPDSQARKQFVTAKLLPGKIGWEACTRVYSKALIDALGLKFEDNRRIFAEDLYFCICYCSAAKKVVSMPECLYNYRRRQDSIMGINWQQLNIGRMNELSKAVYAFLHSHSGCPELVESFPVIHYQILLNVIDRASTIQRLSYPEIRKRAYQELDDISFFQKHLRKLKRHKKTLDSIYKKEKADRLLNLSKYFVDGNYYTYRIRNKLISCKSRFRK